MAEVINVKYFRRTSAPSILFLQAHHLKNSKLDTKNELMDVEADRNHLTIMCNVVGMMLVMQTRVGRQAAW